MEIKTLEFKFADTNTGTMEVAGYGAVFGNTDSYGDVIAPGAFTKTLADFKAINKLPVMLLNHEFHSLPIGVWSEMEEDETGLKVSGKFIDTTAGRDAYTAAKTGAITGFSIGFLVTDFDMSVDGEKTIRTIKGIKLLEVSLVSFPANELAQVTSVKGAADKFDELAAKISELQAAVAALKSSDDDEDEPEDEEKEAEDTEEESEAKYNCAAIEAVKTLRVKLSQEKYGR